MFDTTTVGTASASATQSRTHAVPIRANVANGRLHVSFFSGLDCDMILSSMEASLDYQSSYMNVKLTRS